MKRICIICGLTAWLVTLVARGQVHNSSADRVNVFLGSSGDHGQLSPGAAAPFGMIDVSPKTYPNTHTGYEYKAKEVLGFTHNRMEGVGCMGSGGNLLIKPFIGSDPKASHLVKVSESAEPGFYAIGFSNGMRAAIAVASNSAVELYHFPDGKGGFVLDLSHTLANGFHAEQHQVAGNAISGWIESGTTCAVGIYRVYYHVAFSVPVNFSSVSEHQLLTKMLAVSQDVAVRVAFSSVSEAEAKAALDKRSFAEVKSAGKKSWERELSSVRVSGDQAEERLFYSLLYRTMQSPYMISEANGSYRNTRGNLFKSMRPVYNGWSVWDNYRTQLPLLSLIEPRRYEDMMTSLAALYMQGKQNYATQTEPSNTVRTEHSVVVLLDAYRKGYPVDFGAIKDSLLSEAAKLDFSKPDKALESTYDQWALSEILHILKQDTLAMAYKDKARQWRQYWLADFQNLSKPDVDHMGGRGMYQGTVWQYRWLVPFDLKELIELCGGEKEYVRQLDWFFDHDLYNHANEPDIQAPYLYNGTMEPWKSQAVIRRYAADTVVQYYFNDNSRGIDPFIGRIYTNRPDTYVRTMDDDAGAMSAWYVLAACGLSPACVGWPVYYLHVPLFKTVRFKTAHPFTIKVMKNGKYIRAATLNGKPLNRNWLTHQEIASGGTLVITADNKPSKTWGTQNQFITSINKVE